MGIVVGREGGMNPRSYKYGALVGAQIYRALVIAETG